MFTDFTFPGVERRTNSRYSYSAEAASN